MKVGILYSGGKDSTYAAYRAKQLGHDLTCLITMIPESSESYLFHYPAISWTELQAQSLNLPIITSNVATVGESEVSELAIVIKKAKEKYNFDGIVTGGLASKYQKDRFEKVCNEINLKALSPFWMVNQEDYMMNIVQEGFKVMIVGVAAEGLDKSWLGRIITTDTIKELKNLNNRFGINIAFEGGEAETFTLDCPLFNQRIEVQKIKTHWFNYYGFLEIKNARLIDKTFNAQKS